MCRWMGGMGEWMGGWAGERWVDGWVDEWMGGCTCGSVNGCASGWIGGWDALSLPDVGPELLEARSHTAVTKRPDQGTL